MYILNNILCKPIFHWKLGLVWLPNANEIDTKINGMCMANTKILRLGPNTIYIPLTRVRVLRRGECKFSIFRYQHVGIPIAKFCIGGLSQCMDPTRMFLRRSGI